MTDGITAVRGAPPVAIDGLARIAERFDHALLDQYGVLHDGRRLYPRVLDCLHHLRAAGKTVTILSNSGKPGPANAARLAAIGLAESAYDRIITSGDALRASIAARADAPFDHLGRRCFLISRGNDRTVIDGLDLDLVDTPAMADFLLLAGLDDAASEIEAWRARLAPLAAAGLPMICANPDTTMMGAAGLLPGPGAVAALYRSLGGEVTHIGKPHPQIYAVALRALGDPPSARVLAVGDSLDHDIRGARAIGAAGLFITGGIHAPDFAQVRGREAVLTLTRRLAAGGDRLPDWVMPTLAWLPDPPGESAHD